MLSRSIARQVGQALRCRPVTGFVTGVSRPFSATTSSPSDAAKSENVPKTPATTPVVPSASTSSTTSSAPAPPTLRIATAAKIPKHQRPKFSPRNRPTVVPIKDPQSIHEALEVLKRNKWSKFDETVELVVQLGVDPRKPNQSVKGMVRLPHGVGKTVRVAVFARDSTAEAARAAGAEIVGAEDLIASIIKGEMPFDRCIASPDMMPLLSKVGRILGPRGLMPNPKLGTVTADVATAVKNAKAGQVTFKVDKAGVVHVGIGKISFDSSKLLDNIRTFMVTMSDAKPEGLKGKYVKAAHLSSTMGQGIPLDVGTVDATSPRFMLDPTKVKAA